MARLVDSLEHVLPTFETWYKQDHGPNEDYYARAMTQSYLSNISDKEFVNFFVNFRREGGRIQSGGPRNIDNFTTMLHSNLNEFREYILKPFHKEFDLNSWLDQIESFYQWGFGIATIYLVRINKNKYAILNNKTVNALRMLGFENIRTTNKKTYSYVMDVQRKIMEKYPEINNYYKADALCHYIFAEKEGEKISKKLLHSAKESQSAFIEEFEQERAANQIQADKTLSNNEQLLARIEEINDNGPELIYYTGKQFKRDIYKLELIKKLRGYKCQFCRKTIIKKNKSLYAEACHIKPKAKGGNESLKNILVLCPNCHKEFDLGDRNEVLHNNKKYIVEVNGSKFEITF